MTAGPGRDTQAIHWYEMEPKAKRKLWMQQFIDWKDKTIPIGKRRVAYTRYLMMKFNYSLERAKYYSKMHIH